MSQSFHYLQVHNLPASWTELTIQTQFTPWGLEECKLFRDPSASGSYSRGSQAVLRMGSRDSAEAVLQRFHCWTPEGEPEALVVQFGAQPDEALGPRGAQGPSHWQSAAPLIGMQQQHLQLQQQAISAGVLAPAAAPLQAEVLDEQSQHFSTPITGGASGAVGLDIDASYLLMAPPLPLSGNHGLHFPTAHPPQQQGEPPLLGLAHPHPPLQPQQEGWSSIYIKGLPPDADKLWLYEKFARFGAVDNVRILVDETTGRCNGVGYVNYPDSGAAARAAAAMNGVRMGERLLHVMVQQPHHRRQPQLPSWQQQHLALQQHQGGGGARAQQQQLLQLQPRHGLTWAQAAAVQEFLLQQVRQGWPLAGGSSSGAQP